MNYDLIPEHMRGGMFRYVEQHILPGNFLQAVISNDLMEAFSRADDTNMHRMRDYCLFLYNEAPAECHGSREKMLAWVKQRKV